MKIIRVAYKVGHPECLFHEWNFVGNRVHLIKTDMPCNFHQETYGYYFLSIKKNKVKFKSQIILSKRERELKITIKSTVIKYGKLFRFTKKSKR